MNMAYESEPALEGFIDREEDFPAVGQPDNVKPQLFERAVIALGCLYDHVVCLALQMSGHEGVFSIAHALFEAKLAHGVIEHWTLAAVHLTKILRLLAAIESDDALRDAFRHQTIYHALDAAGQADGPFAEDGPFDLPGANALRHMGGRFFMQVMD